MIESKLTFYVVSGRMRHVRQVAWTKPPERICRSNSTWVITHLLTNDKIVGKTAHKTEWFLDRCAS
jgi:hypothetical protein